MLKILNRPFQWLLDKGTVSSSSGLHLNCMDGLRGLAIIMVVCCHGFYYNPEGPQWTITVSKLISSGWMGVPIFFVLSGFLISYPFFRAKLKDSRSWYQQGYALRRVLKIFPPFYLAIVFFATWAWLRFNDTEYFTTGFQWATGAAHYVTVARDLNGSFWSLWVELHFYLVLPFLFLLFRGVNVRRTYWGMFIVLALVPPLVRALTWPGEVERSHFELITRRFPNALDNFAWGILLAGIYTECRWSAETRRRVARLGYVGLIVLAASAAWLPFAQVSPRLLVEWERFLPGVAAFLMSLFIFDPLTLGSRIFSTPILRFTGVISFEWFLLHQPVQSFFRQAFTTAHGRLPDYLFIVVTPSVLTFVLAALVYFAFSLPILRWGRNRYATRKKTAVLREAAVAD